MECVCATVVEAIIKKLPTLFLVLLIMNVMNVTIRYYLQSFTNIIASFANLIFIEIRLPILLLGVRVNPRQALD